MSDARVKEGSDQALEQIEQMRKRRGTITELTDALRVNPGTIYHWLEIRKVPKEHEEIIDIYYHLTRRQAVGRCIYRPEILCPKTNIRQCQKCGFNPHEEKRRIEEYRRNL